MDEESLRATVLSAMTMLSPIHRSLLVAAADPGSLWNDPKLAGLVAFLAITLLFATIYLMRRKSRDGRGAAAVCLIVSLALHVLLIYFLPALKMIGGAARPTGEESVEAGFAAVTVTDFNPTEAMADASQSAVPEAASLVVPLPLPTPLTEPSDTALEAPELPQEPAPSEEQDAAPETNLPPSLSATVETVSDDTENLMDDLLSQWLSQDADQTASATDSSPTVNSAPKPASAASAVPVSSTAAAHVAGLLENDFGQRRGQAKRRALLATGGDESTETAVEAALQFLAADQRQDGSWDPATSGAGRETLTLGTDRGGAGKRATTGITGLALLSMLGAGNTHLEGPYAENVRRGLSYLIRIQQPDGSLAGIATVYEANYCHGMAALAMCEAAAMTGDESAVRCASAAVRYTVAGQHPTTGGWRYVKGDPGDLSQLGWQAMVLDAGRRAGVPVAPQAFVGTGRFLRSVRSGPYGGLAGYRPGEAPTRTMTAEALATRLLLGERIPAAEIQEAETFLLRQPPGVGKDNYYGWYYTALALHQLQDDAWTKWNAAMKQHLLARQLSNGSWPNDDEWGGYGGRIYSTATAALCLEVYYRHALRQESVAWQDPSVETKR